MEPFAVPHRSSPPEVPVHLRPRLVGLIFILVGLLFGVWVAYDAHSSHFFSLRPSLSSLTIAMGLWIVIEAPELPAREISRLGHVFAGIGMVVGLAFTWYVMGRIPFMP